MGQQQLLLLVLSIVIGVRVVVDEKESTDPIIAYDSSVTLPTPP